MISNIHSALRRPAAGRGFLFGALALGFAGAAPALFAAAGDQRPVPITTPLAGVASTTGQPSEAQKPDAPKPEAQKPDAQKPDVQRPPAPVKQEPRPTEGSGIDPAKQQTGPAPRLESDALDHDFGNAVEGEKLSHTFHLRSAGGAPLMISNAKPTCGCTVAKLEVKKADGSVEVYKYGDPLPPGTEIDLLAQLDTKNKHNQASSKINIYCDDPRTIVTLGLTAKVDTYFQITPPNLAYNEMSISDSAEKTVQVSGKKAGSFHLTLDAKPLPDGMKVELVPLEPDAAGASNRWDVKVVLGPGCREGNLGYPIALRSDEQVAGAVPDKDGVIPTYDATVMVTARIQGLISFEPQYLSFGLVRPGQVMSRSVTLKSFDPNYTFQEPKIRLVGPSDQKPEFPYTSSFSQLLTPSADGKTLTVELTLNGLPESVDGSFQGRVLIETGHPQKPEVQVLFSGVCRPGVKTNPVPVPVPVPQPPKPTPPVGGGQQQ